MPILMMIMTIMILKRILTLVYNCLALLFCPLSFLLLFHSSSLPSLLSFFTPFHSHHFLTTPHHPLGCSVYFCQPDVLKGSLTVTMREVRPTLFFSVPRVWEKIQEKMAEMGRKTTGIKKVISDEEFLLPYITYYCRRLEL
jgi:hypothetical protein